MYSSARAEFCAERSSSFCLETDFGLSGAAAVEEVVSSSAAVDILDVEEESSDRSIPSIMEVDVDVEAAAELARFIRNDRQSPSDSSSI